MSVDLAIATPAYHDLTIVGLEALPALGEERFGGGLARSPGGGAIIAVGAARLGMSTALAAPIGDDPQGRYLREQLTRDGIRLLERCSRTTPTTVVLPVGGDRAMVTVDHGDRCTAAELAAFEPRAVATSLGQLRSLPPGVPAYVTCGEDDARAYEGRPPAGLEDIRTLFISRREALALSGAPTLDEAIGRLAARVPSLVIMLAADGAVLLEDGRRYEAPGVDPGRPVVDTTGAGDLLVAAYAWAEARGEAPGDRLRWAVLYAGLSVTAPTATAGAVDAATLIAEGERRGLVPASAAAPPAASRR